MEWVQLREKDLAPDALLALTECLAAMTRGSGTRLLVNGLAMEQALAHGADGIHLPGSNAAATIQAAVAAGGAVSVSCHMLAEVEAAREGGATLILWAPVFGKTVDGREVVAGTGLDALQAACRVAGPVPIYALGGVSVTNAPLCGAAGTAGIAGIRLFHQEDWRQL